MQITRLAGLVLAFVWLSASVAQAAPAISGVSGTLSDGQTITITGSDFGANGPTIVFFDDFETGTNGQAINLGTPKIGEWSEPVNEGWPTLSNSYAHSGSLAMRQDCSGGEGGQRARMIFSEASEIYMSYWYNAPTALSGNWKHFWFFPDGASWPTNDYIPFFIGAADGTGAYYFGCDDAGNGPGTRYGYTYEGALVPGALDFAIGRWGRVEVYMKQGVTDGIVKGYELKNNGRYCHFDNTIPFPSNMGNRYTADAGYLWSAMDTPYSWEAALSYYYDDVYVSIGSGAQARVEIGNNGVYSSCTNLAIVTVTAWSNTSITATLRSGSFSSGTAYLFVVHADGTVSPGYEITLGSSSGGVGNISNITITPGGSFY